MPPCSEVLEVNCMLDPAHIEVKEFIADPFVGKWIHSIKYCATLYVLRTMHSRRSSNPDFDSYRCLMLNSHYQLFSVCIMYRNDLVAYKVIGTPNLSTYLHLEAYRLINYYREH